MSRRIITTERTINTYEILKKSQDYNTDTKNSKNEINESLSKKKISKEDEGNFTGKSSPNKTQVKYTRNLIEKTSRNTLDSSLQQNSQSMYSGDKWRTNTSKTYGTNKSITNTGYCTCDDGKDSSARCTCYKRYTDKTFNKTMSSNDRNIFIQEGNNTDYCNCDENVVKKFSSATSDFKKTIRNEYTDEDRHTCTCGRQSTMHSTEYNKGSTNNLKYSSQRITSSYNEIPIQTTDYEDKEINIVNKKVIVNKDTEIIREKIREQLRRELCEENENEEMLWNGDNYIQVIERLQFLSAQPPQLRIQYINDMMINRTIDRTPINILIPIPDNYIQKQGVLEVLAEQKEKEEEKDINEDLCPENVDLLDITKAYSTAVPSFNNLEIENVDMYIQGTPKVEEKKDLTIEKISLYCKANEKEPLVMENYSWDINPSERTWTGDMRAVRINKLNIEEQKKPEWNYLIEKEMVSEFDVEASEVKKIEKKIKKIKKKPKKKKIVEKPKEKPKEEPKEEEEEEEEIEEIEQIEEVEVEDLDEKERIRQKKELEELKKRRKDPKKFKTKKFSLTFKENKKQFKKIDIGDNEIITLRAIKRVLQPTKTEKLLKQSDKNNFILGGKGFDVNKYKWAPVLVNEQTMTIENKKIETPLENVPTDKLEMPASRKRKQDWNVVNNLSSESVINILTKEKKLEEEKIGPVTVLGEVGNKKNKWNDKINKQRGVKLEFYPKKKWPLKICKEIDIEYEQEFDDVIINDDYNNVKGPEMRPVTATIIKVNEEDDTSSVSSYDVFQNIIIKKKVYEGVKLRNLFENEQKNKYDKTVKSLANLTKNCIGNN